MTKARRTTLSTSAPPHIVSAIDDARGGLSRSAFILTALERAVKGSHGQGGGWGPQAPAGNTEGPQDPPTLNTGLDERLLSFVVSHGPVGRDTVCRHLGVSAGSMYPVEVRLRLSGLLVCEDDLLRAL